MENQSEFPELHLISRIRSAPQGILIARLKRLRAMLERLNRMTGKAFDTASPRVDYIIINEYIFIHSDASDSTVCFRFSGTAD
jgi:hypothetical protein